MYKPPIVAAIASLALATASLTFVTSASAETAVRPADTNCPPASSAPLSGSGTQADPYLVDDSANLQLLKDDSSYWDDSILQTADIDMAGCIWDRGIGTGQFGLPVFSGHYDGGGYEITGVDISTAIKYAGLFAQVTGTVRDLGFIGDVTSTATGPTTTLVSVGGLVGFLNGGELRLTYASGDITSAYTDENFSGTGGLVGVANGGAVIDGSSASGDVSATNSAGGLVGRTSNSSPNNFISRSYATGDVTVSKRNAGGFAGVLLAIRLSESYATGNVTNTNASTTTGSATHTAGFAGAVDLDFAISDSYSTGGVTGGNNQFGGFVGDIGSTSFSPNSLTRVYSATLSGLAPQSSMTPATRNCGAVNEECGGFIGYRNVLTVNASFWNSQTANPPYADDSAVGTGVGTISGLRGRSTAQMTSILTYTDDTAGWNWNTGGAQTIAAGYDPNYTWGICASVNNGYPFLTGTYSADPCASPVPPVPPTPTPTYPPSEPLNVVGVAGDASAVISWSPPASSGSFAVTDYQVVASPGGHTCLVAAPATTCTLTGLTNGESYTVIVRALNGAGWGGWSDPSASFTPVAPVSKAIVITGTRADLDGRRGVRAFGQTTGLVGATVQARVHLAGEIDYYNGSQRTVGADGSFTWQRLTNKRVYVYFRTLDQEVRSNRIVIAIE